MLPDRQNRVKVRANFDGGVELLVRIGTIVERGMGLCVIEGDNSIERLCAKKKSRVLSVDVEDDAEVTSGQLLMMIQEMPEDD